MRDGISNEIEEAYRRARLADSWFWQARIEEEERGKVGKRGHPTASQNLTLEPLLWWRNNTLSVPSLGSWYKVCSSTDHRMMKPTTLSVVHLTEFGM
jgi:hypothetical protein